MRQLLRTVAITIVCAMTFSQHIDARGRNNNGNNNTQHTQHTTVGPQKQQKPNAPAMRPGNNGNAQHQRPGNNGNAQHQRPGNNGFGNNHMQPPQNNHARPQQPPQAQRPNRPTPTPPNHGNPHDWGRPHGIHFGAPYRPMMPAQRPWAPPMRPAGLRVSGGPVFSTILGVALGTALGVTLNNLVSHGYNVTGYVDNAVYVSDAMQLNLLWPNATLYYDNGGLAASEFLYSTPFYDINRYNTAYNRLVNAYGAPYNTHTLAGGGMSSTWWGPGGQFIQLQFNSGVASNGTTRFFTTLSFGN